ncbi:hypothetical protein DY000_02029515 [Brassica cretica]|uniref:Uncharacterized protein n=1 Tax=Brassica cretica TaxID=69181 RepID=A0ABQ7DGL3_BRACR|nr:hypothetical protein DY000_02029515 [Brassica cretica]
MNKESIEASQIGASQLWKGFPTYVDKWGSFLWARLGSDPLHPEGLYLGWGQGSTSSTAFDDRMAVPLRLASNPEA